MKKLLTKLLLFLTILVITSFIVACGGQNSKDSDEKNNNDFNVQTYHIFQLAQTSGYTGTYEEWLDSISGDEVELNVVDGNLVWKYKSENPSKYRVLIQLADIKGQQGNQGVGINKIEKTQTNDNVDTYTIYYSNDTTSTFTVTNGIDGKTIKGDKGEDGHTPVITIGENGNWYIDGINTDIKAQGENGKDGISVLKIEKTENKDNVDTYTIYYSNDTTSTFTVTNGIDGKTIKGDKGEDGHTPVITIGENGNWYIDGINTDIKAQGENGKDGISVLKIEKTENKDNIDTYTIYYSNDTTSTFTVTNGIDGKTIKGDKGEDGHTPVITIGENGNWYIDGIDTNTSAQGFQGESGKSAYDIYCEKYPDYSKTEEEWLDDLINGNLSNKEKYSVTFIVDDNEIEIKNVETGKTVSKPNDPYKDNYTFEGWFLDDEKWLFNIYPVFNDLELRAKFTSNIHTLVINGNKYNLKYNEEILLPKVNDTDSIKYVGYVDSNNVLYEFNTNYVVKKDDTLTLKGYKKHVISFDAGDGACDTSKLNVLTGKETGGLPTAYKSDFIFRGWKYNNVLYNKSFIYDFDEDITFVAAYRASDELFDFDITTDGIIINQYLGDDTNVVIPEKINSKDVIEIKSTLFDLNKKDIISLTIPNTVTSIETGILEGQNLFEKLCCSDNIPISIKEMFNVSNSKDLPKNFEDIEFSDIDSYPYTLFTANSNKYNFILNSGISKLPDFHNATSMKTVNIPSGITIIEENNFEGCASLLSIILPEGLKKINSYAFYGCVLLKTITVPNTVTEIGNYAFYNCVSLEEITLPFLGSYKYSQGFLGAIFGPNDYSTQSSYIPASLKKVNITDGDIILGNNAFSGCSSITSISLPETLTSIKCYAFSDCSSLLEINLPEGITTIEYNAFYNCRSLTSINLPAGITNIGSYAFGNCRLLNDIVFSGSKAQWNAISKASNWNYNLLATKVICIDGEILL